MNRHETIIFIHIFMSTYKHTHRHIYKYYPDILTRLPILIHITNLPILLHLHVCLGIYALAYIYIHTNTCVNLLLKMSAKIPILKESRIKMT